MNRILLFIVFFLGYAGVSAQTLDATYFMDFGRDDSNGRITSSPDANNNHWNNITETDVSAAAVNLINSVGTSSSVNLTITSAFLKNGIAQGGLTSPSASLLGDFAIATATEDYFYTNTNGKGAFRLSGLNPAKIYIFSIFGTRNATDERTSQYNITGANTSVKTLQTTGTGIGDGGYNGNNNTIVVSDYIIPTTAGTIDIELTKTAGGYGYIGIIKMAEYIPASGYQYDKLNTSYFLDFGLNDGTNGNITASPDANNNHWNNIIDPAVSAAAVNLINNTGGSSAINLTITSAFLRNGRQTGGLLSPSAELLGEFAIATATEDYFYTNTNGKGTFQLTGLDPAKSYVFKFFGTREATQTRISQYKITGDNTSIKTLATTGTGVGANNYNGNNNNIVISDYVKPTAAGIIDIELTKTAGDFGYVGIIKIEEYVPTTLPVQLKSFNGSVINEGIKLVWATASEQNTSRFEIESKYNGSAFQKIAEITASGNSNTSLDYSFTDKTPYNTDNVYYRLKIADNDGTVTYSNVINVKLNGMNRQEFSIYPNPFTNQIKVSCPNAMEGAITIRIINSNGVLVKEIITFTAVTDIDTSVLTEGIYILNVTNNGKIVGTQKILKL